jgi:bifunctional non-homologous end joining protein LigD
MRAVATKKTDHEQPQKQSVRSGRGEKLKTFSSPMLATLHDQPFNDPGWIFEVKWDGYRAVAETGKSIRLYSRNGLSFLSLYRPVAEALKKIRVDAVLDGEIVVLNSRHKPDFQKLQQFNERSGLAIKYYIFDCLSVKGKSITHLPLVERKKIVRALLPDKNDVLVYSDHVEEVGKDVFKHAIGMDLEGIIAKRADSKYLPGKRSRDWLKIKNHNTQEAIIAGYTAPRGSRSYFGALLLAIMKKGKFVYIGHTGTGFTDQSLKMLHMKLYPLRRPDSPFEGKIPVNGQVTWVDPILVCNVKFTEVTQDGILRHPVFQGLRIDKSSKEVNHLDTPFKTVKKTSARARVRKKNK